MGFSFLHDDKFAIAGWGAFAPVGGPFACCNAIALAIVPELDLVHVRVALDDGRDRLASLLGILAVAREPSYMLLLNMTAILVQLNNWLGAFVIMVPQSSQSFRIASVRSSRDSGKKCNKSVQFHLNFIFNNDQIELRYALSI